MKYDLSQEKWELTCTNPYVPLLGYSVETGVKMEGIYPWMPASVPGGVALTLYRNGYIEYPYFEMNSLKCEWIENKWWMYRTTFKKPKLKGEKIKLVFKGIDYDALIFLNGIQVGAHEGMYEPAVIDITEAYNENQHFDLLVIIKSAPDEMGQIGHTSQTFTQKSRFNYKWDFGTRLVNLGLWQGVELVAEPAHVLEDVYVRSDVDDNKVGHIRVSASVRSNNDAKPAGIATVNVSFAGKNVCRQAVDAKNGIDVDLAIPEPKLWWPNGMGAQPLYQVTVEMEDCDTFTCRQGIRKLEYLQNEDVVGEALPYTFTVNGQKVHIAGVNMTPLDHIYGDITYEQYRYTVLAAANMNVNMIRVWGGGLIEKEEFYDLCDELGIMVWQEFVQSSSGIDNIPSKVPHFLELIEKSVRSAVPQKRNHTSLTVWSGGNELMDANGVPSTYEDENLALLKSLVEELDPARMFLPTSASGPVSETHLKPHLPHHDVHGNWKYEGNPQTYELYNKVDNLFHSEFGCDGMNSIETLEKIMSSKNRKPVRMSESPMWRFHGDWWCTYDRNEYFFGKTKDIEDYIKESQWIQAEGLRYILESNARRKYHNSGTIIWQFNEPWPNVSVTSLLEYYGYTKPAYYWVKKAYAPYHISMKYDKLDHAVNSAFVGEAYLTTNGSVAAKSAKITCEVLDVAGNILYTKTADAEVVANRAVKVMDIRFNVASAMKGLFFVRLKAYSDQVNQADNLYTFSTESKKPYAAAYDAKCKLKSEVALRKSDNEIVYSVTNEGKEAAINVFAKEKQDKFNILCDLNYVTIFPGETKTFHIRYEPKFRFGFDEYKDVHAGKEPKIAFEAFNQPGLFGL